MLQSRNRGLMLIHTMVILCVLPLWFLLLVYIAVEVIQWVNYSLIQFPTYLFGITVATLISFRNRNQTLLRGTNTRHWIEAIRIANTETIILALVLFGIVFATKDKGISRLFLGTFILSTWFLLILLNRYLPLWLGSIIFRGAYSFNSLLVGNSRTVRKMDEWIHEKNAVGMTIVGLVTSEDDEHCEIDLPILGKVSRLHEIIEKNNIQQIVLLESKYSKGWVNEIVSACKQNGCRLLILNHWEEYFDQPIIPIDEGDHNFFTLQEEPLQNPINRIIKTCLDIVVAVPIVILILPSLCIFVKIMQSIQAPGPLFFRQKRSGFNKREFTILKFRSMHHTPKNEELEAKQATPNDSRIFPFGRFLRRSSLDEFPQFLNVLLGHMSIVGPRPHMVRHDKKFSRLVEVYYTRSFVKPGITGLAQCKGFRGEVTEVELIEKRVNLDLEYINKWSIWWDIGLILKTIHIIFVPHKTAI